MVVILGVVSLDLWYRLLGDCVGFAWASCAWYHVTREMDRGPVIL